MAIVAVCSGCNVRLTLGDERAGEAFECPRCDAIIKIPSASSSPEIPLARPVKPPPASSRRPTPQSEPVEDDDDALPVANSENEPSEGLWADKRVRIGVFAGAGLILAIVAVVSVFVVAFAFRKPVEIANQNVDRPAEYFTPPTLPETVPTIPTPVTAPTKKIAEVPPPKKPVPDEGPKWDESNPQFKAQFLGSQAKGRRFCIIADNSGSMAGEKIADLRTQLLKTLAETNQLGEFFIYCFNSKAEPMPHTGWLKGSAPEAEKIKKWIREIKTAGGTLPMPAFDAAFKLSPPPDVIFFMTDGIIPTDVPGKVVALNKLPTKVVVNTIMFANPNPKGANTPKVSAASGREEDLLKRIAEQNGGTFTRYVPE
jgi:hypothetical protein